MEISNAIFVAFLIPAAFTDGRLCSVILNGLLNDSTAVAKEHEVIYETVRFGHYIELNCCSSETEDFVFSWMKKNKTSRDWEVYTPDRIDISFYKNKQILSIKSSTFDDEGSYRCAVQNDSLVMEATDFHLDVVACDKLARGPYAISPLSCPETITHEGETLTLPCTGYFGCAEDGDIRIVTWFVSDTDGDWEEASSVDKRYKKIEFLRDGGAAVGANLTILGVSELDFNRKFMCLLASPQVVEGQTKIFVNLKKGSSTVVSNAIFLVSTVAVILLVINVFMSVVMIYRNMTRHKRTIKRTSGQEWIQVASGDIKTAISSNTM